jgi:hypothetical protein
VRRKQLPNEAMADLRRRLNAFPPRSRERRQMIEETAQLYNVSEDSLYRALRTLQRPQALRRADFGEPRTLPKEKLERYCEVIAAMKIRTSNKKGRHLSTVQAIRLLEDYGVNTPEGHLQTTKGQLKKTTVNRYLKRWGYDHNVLLREPPAVRFEASHSNDCWHFDLSPSDLKHVKKPAWIEEGRGHPLLMLYSVVDDRSGVAYQEYHGVYGEDVGAALRFLFNAMAPKPDDRFPFAGIPALIYTDSGPLARSQIFHQVMGYLGVEVRTHMPQGKDGRRTTGRAKGKVERPFRTVKELHETLYHFHEPETEDEANAWLFNFLLRYNAMPHRSEPHSRLEDWLNNLPSSGLREMCDWDRYCTFAREPEKRKVGIDARISVDGVPYEIEPELVGETVILWLGLFDDQLYVEYDAQRYGPYYPVGGPIPLHRYRRFKKTRTEQRADRVEILAQQLELPKAALEEAPQLQTPMALDTLPRQPFIDPDPFQELTFPSVIAAKKAIADYLVMPLARLPTEQLNYINELVAETLDKQEVMAKIRDYFKAIRGR